MELLEKKMEAQDSNMKMLTDVRQQCQQESRKADDNTHNAYTHRESSGTKQSDVSQENARCELLHWYNYDAEEVVAEGKIASTDPRSKVHHMPLGRDYWKVWIDEAIVPSVKLYRHTDEAQIIEEAMGTTVAWPKSSIRLI